MTPAWMVNLKTLCKCRHDFKKTGATWGLFLSPDTLVDAAKGLFQAGFFLEDISGLNSADGFVTVYHLSPYSGPGRVVLYVIVPHHDPKIPTISAVYSGALWHEREAMDFFRHPLHGSPGPETPAVARRDDRSSPDKRRKKPHPVNRSSGPRRNRGTGSRLSLF